MALVRKAVAEDFEGIYPLLVKFNNPRLSKDDWRSLFFDNWHSNEGYFGYVLEEGEHIVGFLGLMFSSRMLNDKEEKFCNITSWIVEKKFRSQSLLLLLPVLKLQSYTLTICTASKETYAVARKLGFQDLESSMRIIFPTCGKECRRGQNVVCQHHVNKGPQGNPNHVIILMKGVVRLSLR